MQTRFGHSGPAQAGGAMRGTFYPDSAVGGPSAASAVPRILAVLGAVLFMRMLAKAARHHGHGGSARERRMDGLARLHRELHARDEGSAAKASGEVSA